MNAAGDGSMAFWRPSGLAATMDANGGMSFLVLPRLCDGLIDVMLKNAAALPQDLCLLLDRDAEHPKILGVAEALHLCLSDVLPSKTAPAAYPDQFGTEVLQVRCSEAHDGQLEPKPADSDVGVRHAFILLRVQLPNQRLTTGVAA